jgi:hypothetical protein
VSGKPTVPPLTVPWWHWGVLLAIASMFTAILFTRCCGQAVSPIAVFLIFPYVLGSLLGGASHGIIVAIGFALGITLELGLAWWLLRTAVILGMRWFVRRG